MIVGVTKGHQSRLGKWNIFPHLIAVTLPSCGVPCCVQLRAWSSVQLLFPQSYVVSVARLTSLGAGRSPAVNFAYLRHGTLIKETNADLTTFLHVDFVGTVKTRRLHKKEAHCLLIQIPITAPIVPRASLCLSSHASLHPCIIPATVCCSGSRIGKVPRNRA